MDKLNEQYDNVVDFLNDYSDGEYMLVTTPDLAVVDITGRELLSHKAVALKLLACITDRWRDIQEDGKRIIWLLNWVQLALRSDR